MNYTMFYFCDCGFQEPINESDNLSVKQCKRCFRLKAYEPKDAFFLVCQACGKKTSLPNNCDIGISDMTCVHCGLRGKAGIKEVHRDALLLLETEAVQEDACQACRSKEWIDPSKEDMKCPSCRGRLKQKMSSMWAEGEDEAPAPKTRFVAFYEGAGEGVPEEEEIGDYLDYLASFGENRILGAPAASGRRAVFAFWAESEEEAEAAASENPLLKSGFYETVKVIELRPDGGLFG